MSPALAIVIGFIGGVWPRIEIALGKP